MPIISLRGLFLSYSFVPFFQEQTQPFGAELLERDGAEPFLIFRALEALAFVEFGEESHFVYHAHKSHGAIVVNAGDHMVRNLMLFREEAVFGVGNTFPLLKRIGANAPDADAYPYFASLYFEINARSRSVAHIEAPVAEKDVVPDEHLFERFFGDPAVDKVFGFYLLVSALPPLRRYFFFCFCPVEVNFFLWDGVLDEVHASY